MTESELPELQPQPADTTLASSEEQAAAPAAGSGIEEQLAAAKKEAVENYSRYLRAVADLENSRKRAVREKDELRQYAATRVLEDLLPVLDNLALGLSAAKRPNAEAKTIIDGVEMVISQLKNSLAGHGLKEINPVGQVFDPHQHEAISHMPSAEVPAEHVLMVIRTGYSLNGRLLRPAAVVVSGGPSKGESTSTL